MKIITSFDDLIGVNVHYWAKLLDMAADANNAQLLHSPLVRAPYIILLDLKPLIEDGNLQV